MSAPAPLLVLASGWAWPPQRLEPLARALAGVPVAFVGPDELRGTLAAAPAPCWVGGWSLGGLRALEAAAAYPDRVRGLVVIGSTARFCAAPGYPCGQPAAALRAMAGALASRPRGVLAEFFRGCAAPRQVDGALVCASIDDALTAGVDALRAGLEALRRIDLREAAARFPVPALLLHGERDAVVPAGAARWLAGALPRARLLVHPDAGHDVPIAEPAWTAAAIREFVGR